MFSEYCPFLLARSGFADYRGCDDIALNLVRSLINLGDFRVAHHLLDRIFAHIAIAAENLNSIGGNFHRDIAGEKLGHRGFFADFCFSGVDSRGNIVNEGSRGNYLGGHIGQHPLKALIRDDRPSELNTLAGVSDRRFEGALGDPDRLRSYSGARRIEGFHCDHEAHTLFRDKILSRNSAILEDKLTGCTGTNSHFILFFAVGKSGGAVLDDKSRCSARAACWVCKGDDGVNFCLAAVCYPLFGAVENVFVAVFVAVVLIPPASEPASGSVRAKAVKVWGGGGAGGGGGGD